MRLKLWVGREPRLRRSLDGAHDRLLGLGRPALGLAGALFGLGDALPHLPQALLALFLFGPQPFQALRLDRPLLGGLGPLLDLTQAVGTAGSLETMLAGYERLYEAAIASPSRGLRPSR